jgi:hypothetical protein
VFSFLVRFFDSLAPESVSPGRGRISPHFQQRGGISRAFRRSSDTKFCDEHATQARIMRAILPFFPCV